MEESFYEPSKRYLHCSAVVQNKWYNYGGIKSGSPTVIEEFDPVCQVWKQRQTSGDPPPGVIGSAAASIGSKFYHFGGLNESGSYSNTIHVLDIEKFEWNRLEPKNQDGVCPIPKMGAAMVSFDNRLLVTFGGKGEFKACVRSHALYASNPDSADRSLVWTNELICFDTKSREWFIPRVIREGQPTACAGCSLTMVDYFRAVLFGGYGVGDICVPNCVRILHMAKNEQWCWSIVRQGRNEIWPKMRSCHSAVSLYKVGNKEAQPPNPGLLIMFGWNKCASVLKDAWIYDVNTKQWSLGDFPESMIKTIGGSVQNSTCMVYHQSDSTRKILFQFGGVILEEICNNPLPGTNVFDLDLLPNNQLKTVGAKHLKASWISVKPEYEELILGGERKHNFSRSQQLMDLSDDVGISIKFFDDGSGKKSMETEVTVQPCYSGPFTLPKGYDKASPLYMIKESNLVRKTARIKINHHAKIENEEDRRSMVFLQGDNVPKRGKSELTYDLSIMCGGDASFEIGKDTGEVTVQELTPLCVARKLSFKQKSKNAYGLKLYYAAPSCREGSWDAVLTMYLYQKLYCNALSSYMKQHHPSLTEETVYAPVYFKNDVSGHQVDHEFDDNLKVKFTCFQNDWSVTGSKKPIVISKKEVDLPCFTDISLEESQDYPPKIKLRFTPKTQRPVSSECVIQVVGLVKDSDYGFIIPLYINKPVEKPPVDNSHYLHMLLTVLDDVAAKWKDIGLALGFKPGALDCIEQAPMLIVKGVKAYFQELIRQWLEWTPPEHDSPTIPALCDALRNSLVGEPVFADKLNKKIKEVTDESLCKLRSKYEDELKTAIDRFEAKSAGQWEANDMIQESDNVAALMKNMIFSLENSDKMNSNSEEIEKSCKQLASMAKDMITEIQHSDQRRVKDYAEGMKTESELLKKYVHMPSIVVPMDQMIRSMINLAHSMENFWDCMQSVIKQLPQNATEEHWKRRTKLKRSNTCGPGTVLTLKRRLESSRSHEPTADHSDPAQMSTSWQPQSPYLQENFKQQ